MLFDFIFCENLTGFVGSCPVFFPTLFYGVVFECLLPAPVCPHVAMRKTLFNSCQFVSGFDEPKKAP